MPDTQYAHWLTYTGPDGREYEVHYDGSVWMYLIWNTPDMKELVTTGSVSLEQASSIGKALDYIVQHREGTNG